MNSVTLRNRPTVGQVVRWIEPEEYRNPDFVRTKREKYPGELTVVSIENGREDNEFRLNIAHNGETIMNLDGQSAIFNSHWFHWDGE
jgi:hypothetical protein